MSRTSINQYPSDWKDIAYAIKVKRGFTCQGCSQIGNLLRNVLTVHHIDYDPANNADSNLLVLCQKCHLALQQGNPPHLIRQQQGQLSLPT